MPAIAFTAAFVVASLTLTACASAPPTGRGTSTDDTPTTPTLLDDFENLTGWTAHPADGVRLDLSSDDGFDGRCLRMDFAFTGGGYAVARRAFDVALPENYEFSFRVRGEAQANHFEFKLLDDTGENVWWFVRRDVAFDGEWDRFVVKKRHISFAWGPRGGGDLERVAAVEFVVTAGSGGTGTVWIDDFRLTALPSADAPLPKVVASASSDEDDAPNAIDGNESTAWTARVGGRGPWLALDFGRAREYGGFTIDWEPGAGATTYVVETSDDGKSWSVLHEVVNGNGGRDYIYAPESESRWARVRIAAAEAGRVSMREIVVEPLSWSATRNAFFSAIAADAPRGTYPRGFLGEQAYWTVVGAAEDAGEKPPQEFLVGEDGAVELGPDLVTLEPFLFVDGELLTWADVETSHDLLDHTLPIPIVRWRAHGVALSVTASAARVEYLVLNERDVPVDVRLFLAVRPFQVNPPSQTLNRSGGTARVGDVASLNGELVVNGVPVAALSASHATFGAVPFDGGDIIADYLRRGRVPEAATVTDPFGAASGAWSVPLELPPGRSSRVEVGRLWKAPQEVPPDSEWFGLDADAWVWRDLRRVTIDLPESARAIRESIESQIAYVFVNRSGFGIRPGARSYARSWIRDGALTSTALLRMGQANAARAFLEWYAPHQYESGKIPCVVDDRGADPVPEHDSSGEFIYLVAELVRYADDHALARRLWPQVVAAVDYLDALRQQRRTDEYRGTEFFGLLPPSISHEGYSAKPMHSYWDDFFARRGFRDAVFLAGVLGHLDEAARIAKIADEFESDLRASVDAAMRAHDIDYVPGCADLGDFDATSTTIAFDPTGSADVLDPEWIRRTFERYWEFFVARRDGELEWDAYTPYEIRNIGAFVRLGWRERALELCDFFLADQRPPGWRQWPEVIRRDPREAAFLGDLPHTWVGSDFVRSALDLLAYEDRSREALVLAAGVPASWLRDGGVGVEGLRTPYGRLTYRMSASGDTIECTIEAGVEPPGGIVLRPPLDGRIRSATIDGRAVRTDGTAVVVSTAPARVVLRMESPGSSSKAGH